MSELFGRSRVLQIANMWYLGMYDFLIFKLRMSSSYSSVEPGLRLCTKHGAADCLPLPRRSGWECTIICQQTSSFIYAGCVLNLVNLQIGGGVLGDLWKPEERGQAIALYSLAPLLGPVIGPTCGAWIAQRSTWRWVVCVLLHAIATRY